MKLFFPSYTHSSLSFIPLAYACNAVLALEMLWYLVLNVKVSPIGIAVDLEVK